MTKEELLKKLYYDLKNPATFTGKSKLLQEVKKIDSNISIENVAERYIGASQLRNEASLGA